jgi:hypothetical protein
VNDELKINMVKANLSRFLPALVEFIGKLEFPWDRIDRFFSDELTKRQQKIDDKLKGLLASGNTSDPEDVSITLEVCIYDVIVLAAKGNSTAIGFLHFLNMLFFELTDTLQLKEKILVCSNVRQMLISFDLKYQDFLGEIAVLRNLITSKIYNLEAIEEQPSNSIKPIDFKLRKIETGNIVWVEVLNIHLVDERVNPDSVAIHSFLKGRIVRKLEQKAVNVSDRSQFHLIPVLWGNSDSLKIYSDFFRTNIFQIPNVMEPIGYLTYSDGHGYYEHYFKPVSKLFKE